MDRPYDDIHTDLSPGEGRVSQLVGRVRLLLIRLRQVLPQDHGITLQKLPENHIDAINSLERIERLMVDSVG